MQRKAPTLRAFLFLCPQVSPHGRLSVPLQICCGSRWHPFCGCSTWIILEFSVATTLCIWTTDLFCRLSSSEHLGYSHISPRVPHCPKPGCQAGIRTHLKSYESHLVYLCLPLSSCAAAVILFKYKSWYFMFKCMSLNFHISVQPPLRSHFTCLYLSWRGGANHGALPWWVLLHFLSLEHSPSRYLQCFLLCPGFQRYFCSLLKFPVTSPFPLCNLSYFSSQFSLSPTVFLSDG